MIQTAVLDIGMGNLDSVVRAIAECGGHPQVTRLPEQVANASHIVLPGVGAFARGADCLQQSGLIPTISEAVFDKKTPILGICLGMQLLCSRGSERGIKSTGLGWIAGEVVALPCQNDERSPHVGWNDVEPTSNGSEITFIDQCDDFYFTHSYCAIPDDPKSVLATTPFAGGFASVIGHRNIFGVQFHPEKSQGAGRSLLTRFLQC